MIDYLSIKDHKSREGINFYINTYVRIYRRMHSMIPWEGPNSCPFLRGNLGFLYQNKWIFYFLDYFNDFKVQFDSLWTDSIYQK